MQSTPENIERAVSSMGDLKADMGGTALYAPLCDVYNKPPVPGMSF